MCCAASGYVEAPPASRPVLAIPTFRAFFLAGELAAAAGGQPFHRSQPQLDLSSRCMTARASLGPDRLQRPGQSGALTDVSRSHAWLGDRMQVGAPNLSGVFIPAGGFASRPPTTSVARGDAGPGRRAGRPAGALRRQREGSVSSRVIGREPGFAEFPPIDNNSAFDYSPGWGVYQYNA